MSRPGPDASPAAVLADPSAKKGFPINLGASGEANPLLVDLDDGNTLRLALILSSGAIGLILVARATAPDLLDRQAGDPRRPLRRPRRDMGGKLEGMINLPIADRIAFRASAFWERDTGFIDNIFGERTYLAPNPVDDVHVHRSLVPRLLGCERVHPVDLLERGAGIVERRDPLRQRIRGGERHDGAGVSAAPKKVRPIPTSP